ncbi:MAG: hypothetical protein GY805_08710 [Chloroflexi bacterium]|nr:hypothetical protein [Chloroflexota bacterium]
MILVRIPHKMISLILLFSVLIAACNKQLPAPTAQSITQTTPIPATQQQPSPVAILLGSDKLQAVRLTVNDNFVTVEPAITLLENAAMDVEAVKVVQNGQAILYRHRLGDGGNGLSLIAIEEGAEPQLLVRSDSLPPAQEAYDPEQSRRLINKFDQLPKSEGFWFNTTTDFLDESGFDNFIRYDDLWVVPPDGTKEELLSSGTGLGIMLSNQEQLLFVQADILDAEQSAGQEPFTTVQGQIIRMNLDGSDRAEFGPFDFPYIADQQIIGVINKQWIKDGRRAYIIIPSTTDTYGEGVLWQIPSQGEPQELGVLAGNYFFGTLVVWSDNGAQMAFVDRPRNPLETQLFIADGDGQDRIPYDETEISRNFFGWHPDESHFLFGGSKYFALGMVGEEPQEYRLRSLHRPSAAVWITDNLFLVTSLLENGPELALSSGTIGGEIDLLYTAKQVQDFVLWTGQDK